MSRYIDADAFCKEIVKIQDLRKLSTKTIGEALHRIPTADVVEVVRCKDCYWYIVNELKADGTEDKRYKPSRCSFFDILSREDDYCSYGERRTDEQIH